MSMSSMQPGGNEDDNYTDNEASISMFLGKINSAFADTIIPELYSNKEDDDGNKATPMETEESKPTAATASDGGKTEDDTKME